MDVAKKITNSLCVVLVILSLLVIGAHLYYKTVKPTTSATINIGNQAPINLMEKTDELTQEQLEYYQNRVLFNFNVYDNTNNNGLEVQEMNLEFFTSFSLQDKDCRATGMQHIGELSEPKLAYGQSPNTYKSNDFVYYDTTYPISWVGNNIATQLTRDTKFIVKVDNRPYRIQLTYVENGGFLGIQRIHHSYSSVFWEAYQAVKSNNKGYGDWYITINLSKLFTIEAFNTETKQWERDLGADEVFAYSVLKMHYSPDGMQKASQSFFGAVDCNSKWSYRPEIEVDYWQERILYNYTINELSCRYSEAYGGYFLYLNSTAKAMFANMPRARLVITIDIGNDNSILGLDYYAFADVDVDSLTILGSGEFMLNAHSLTNTGLTQIILDKNITLQKQESCSNNELTEVYL